MLSIFSNGCSLLTSQELKTFSISREGTTINLAFITEGLAQNLIACDIETELNHSSNHQSVLIRFQFCLSEAPVSQPRQ